MKNYSQFLAESKFSLEAAINSLVQNFNFGTDQWKVAGSKKPEPHPYYYGRTTITHSKNGFKITIQTTGYTGESGVGKTLEEAWNKAVVGLAAVRDKILYS